LKSKLDAIGVPLVPIVVPAPQERIKAIVASGGGFVYLMMGQQKMKRHSLISLMTLQSK